MVTYTTQLSEPGHSLQYSFSTFNYLRPYQTISLPNFRFIFIHPNKQGGGGGETSKNAAIQDTTSLKDQSFKHICVITIYHKSISGKISKES